MIFLQFFRFGKSTLLTAMNSRAASVSENNLGVIFEWILDVVLTCFFFYDNWFSL